MRRELTSVRSPRVKSVRSLAKRSIRQRERRFLAEGPQAVGEALGRPGVLVELFTTAHAEARHGDVVRRATKAGVPVHHVSGEVMGELAQTVTPQGLLGVCGFLDVPLQAAMAHRPRLVAVLARVRDPGNAGTVLRTADAAGAGAVVCTDASVDLYNGKCVRASAGSLFHLPVVIGGRIEQTVEALHDFGLQVVAADGSAELGLDKALARGVLDRPTAWVFGNEAWGLSPEVLRLADEVVRVPLYGKAESLNLAIAAGVCLYSTRLLADRRTG